MAAQEKPIDTYTEKFAQLEVRQPPDTLYHYTSNEALLKINSSKSLWMTHALFTNDSAEFSHGMKKFKAAFDILDNVRKRASPQGNIREWTSS